MLASNLTHFDPVHLAVNMLWLWEVGRDIILFGVPIFLWAIGGIAGSAATLYRFALTEREEVVKKSMGMSASICAM